VVYVELNELTIHIHVSYFPLENMVPEILLHKCYSPIVNRWPIC